MFSGRSDASRPITRADLSGKTIIITGANTGIGFETARHFASMSPGLLILACRNEEKGRAAVQDIAQSTGSRNVEYWHLDLITFGSVRAFVTRFQSEGHTLDLLVLNGAICPFKLKLSEHGWESAVQVNYLSNVFLTLLLLPTFSKRAVDDLNPRVVFVGSSGHYQNLWVPEAKASNFLEKLNDTDHYSKYTTKGLRYTLTKLMIILFARRLAAILPADSPITVNVVDPGLCDNVLGLMSEWKGTPSYVFALLWRNTSAYPTEYGSRAILDAALSPSKGQAAHGRYISDLKVVAESAFALSEAGKELEEKLWRETIDVLSKVDDTVLDCLPLPEDNSDN